MIFHKHKGFLVYPIFILKKTFFFIYKKFSSVLFLIQFYSVHTTKVAINYITKCVSVINNSTPTKKTHNLIPNKKFKVVSLATFFPIYKEQKNIKTLKVFFLWD